MYPYPTNLLSSSWEFPLRLYEIDRWKEYSLFVCRIHCNYFLSLSFALYFQSYNVFPIWGSTNCHIYPPGWLLESPKLATTFPNLSAPWQGLSTRQISKNSFFRVSQHVQHTSQALASLDQKHPHWEDITVYNFLMRILRHRKAKCSAHECSSLDLNSNRLTWWRACPPSHKMLTAGAGPSSLFFLWVCCLIMRDRERKCCMGWGKEWNKEEAGTETGSEDANANQGQSLFFRVKDIPDSPLITLPLPENKSIHIFIG